MPNELDRRGFLRAGALAAGGLVFGDWTPAEAAELPKRKLGATGMPVTIMSCGGCRDPRVIDHAIDRGINLFHTSVGYGNGACLDALGEVMKRRRGEVFLALKEGPLHPDFDGLLRRLNTDHVDLVVPPMSADTRGDARTVEAFERKRQEGKVRHLGFAGHDTMVERIQCRMDGKFKAMLVSYNLGSREALDPVMRQAAGKGMGFLAMKSAKGLNPRAVEQWQAGLRSLLTNDAMTSLCLGMGSIQQVDTNVNAVLQRNAKADWDFARYAAAAAPGLCSFCGRCEQACPRGIALCDHLRAELYHSRGDVELARELLAALPVSLSLAACDHCGACDQACPKRLPVSALVRAAAEG